MSWIVQTLLLNRHGIKSLQGEIKTIELSDEFSDGNGDVPITEDFEIAYIDPITNTDDYNFLVSIEKKLDDLLKKGDIDQKELYIINELSLGKFYKEIGTTLGMDQRTVKNIFRAVCDRIAFSLGGVFTDGGYINYISEKYNLPPFAVEKLISIIENNERI